MYFSGSSQFAVIVELFLHSMTVYLGYALLFLVDFLTVISYLWLYPYFKAASRYAILIAFATSFPAFFFYFCQFSAYRLLPFL